MISVPQRQILLQGPGLTEDPGGLSLVSLMELLSQHTVQAHLRISSMLGCSLGPPQCVRRQVQSRSGFCTLFSTARAIGLDELLLPGAGEHR